MAKTLKYGRSDANFADTNALRKYRDDNNLTTAELAVKLDEPQDHVSRWISRERVPRAVLEKLGVTVRGPYAKRADKKTVSSIPAGGTIYACYVGAAEKTAFLAFCAAMHISAKDMI